MSKLKLVGLTLDEVFNNGYHGFIDYRLTHEDWNYLQKLYEESLNEDSSEAGFTQEDLDDTVECSYSQGLFDGGDSEREDVRLRRLLDENNIEYYKRRRNKC